MCKSIKSMVEDLQIENQILKVKINMLCEVITELKIDISKLVEGEGGNK